ncbi:MAG TPA: ParA family protein [Candidatus Paceibacterota bacterium]|nr:ParA family protein [Candidatus Paceibacterota bacterium]
MVLQRSLCEWRMAKVISFINHKVGVGKTTSAYHIGCSLAGHHKKRVLFIDIDPQTNLAFLCAPVEKWQKFKKKNGTIADVYRRYQEKKLANRAPSTKGAPIKTIARTQLKAYDVKDRWRLMYDLWMSLQQFR